MQRCQKSHPVHRRATLLEWVWYLPWPEMSPEPPDPPGPHGPGQAGALPSQGYQDITPVASFNIFFWCVLCSAVEISSKKSLPHLHQIWTWFDNVSTPDIDAMIWQPHLHALSTTSSSSCLIFFWSSWPAQAPCNQEMRWCGLQQGYCIRHSTMFSKQCQQAMSSSFSEVEEQAASVAPSSHVCVLDFNMFQPHLYCQVSREANSCDEQQVADVLSILFKVTFSAILKIGVYRIYDTPPCLPSNLSRQCPRVLRLSPLTSEICPVWKWKNKLHQLRHQCQEYLLFNNWNWCKSGFFHNLCLIFFCYSKWSVSPCMEAPQWEPHLHTFPTPLLLVFRCVRKVLHPTTHTRKCRQGHRILQVHTDLAKLGHCQVRDIRIYSCRKFNMFLMFFVLSCWNLN